MMRRCCFQYLLLALHAVCITLILPLASAQNREPCVVGDVTFNETVYCDPSCTKCDPEVGCVLGVEGWCYIRGFCQQDGHLFTSKNGWSSCQICNSSQSTSQWSLASSGMWCNDLIYCNGDDSCVMNTFGNSSQCLMHSGDPCIDNPYCNNTCSESAQNCHRIENITCGTDAACSTTECLEGECQSIPKPDRETFCGNGTSCTQDLCLSGLCMSVPMEDETLCGENSECSIDMCVQGLCVSRSPDPMPPCSLCPCSSGEICDSISELCTTVDDKDSGVNMIYIGIGLGLGGGAFIAIIGLFVYRRFKSVHTLQYALLEADLEDEKSVVVFATTESDCGSGGGASNNRGSFADPPTAKEVRKSNRVSGKSTMYVREDEDTGHRRINKKV